MLTTIYQPRLFSYVFCHKRNDECTPFSIGEQPWRVHVQIEMV